jgi:ABC-type sulfate/molybdate transport systems ATPase subunit
MSLLVLERVTKRYRRGRLERVAIRDVSLEIDAGELVAVWGPRFSGRSTLLRVAAGIESPEGGIVCFEGRDLARVRNHVLGRKIGYCQTGAPSAQHGLVIEHVSAGLLAQRALPRQARRRGQELLFRVGAEDCARLHCHELAGTEVVRVAIATALATAPRLLVIDEPTSGVDVLERDPLLALLRSIANEGTAVLMSTGDAQGLSGVDRALAIDSGELRGQLKPGQASVVMLRPAEYGAGRR